MSALAALALQSGLPIIKRILLRELGDKGGQLAAEVLGQIAAKAQLSPEALEEAAERNPGTLIDAMRGVEKESPLVLGLYASDLQLQLATLAAEQDEPLWARAWRPAGMYMIGFLWLWNAVLLQVFNAVLGTALPMIDAGTLIQLSGLYMGLYMGGHTVKDVVAKMVTK